MEFVLFQTIIFLIDDLIAIVNENPTNKILFIIAYSLLFIWLYLFIPAFFLSIRRLHDTGRSGLYVLLYFIPIGFNILLIFFCEESIPQSNIYGPSLKYFSSNQSPIIPIVDQRNILIQENIIDFQENIVSPGNVDYTPQVNYPYTKNNNV